MVSKDQAIGGLICLVCVVVGVLYTLGLFLYGYVWRPAGVSQWSLAFTLIALPVFIAFIAILAIGAWIGWTMATTPPPKPIEDINVEMESEAKTTTEEKPPVTEEKAQEEKSQDNPPETPKPERKKRSQ
jgi:predicted DNA-binding transcriptional regulator